MRQNSKVVTSLIAVIVLSLAFSAGAQEENPALSNDPVAPVTTLIIDQVKASGTLSTGNADTLGWCSGPYIDLTAAAVDVRIVSFEMYFQGTVNRDVEVFWKAGTYVGFETVPGAWTSLGTVNVTPGGNGTLTPINLGGVDIPAGQTYGFKVWDGGTGQTNGPGLDLRLGGTTASDANLSLSSFDYTCDDPFVGHLTNWGWQGNVMYGDVPVELMKFEIE